MILWDEAESSLQLSRSAVFSHEQSCLRLIRALACEQVKDGLDGVICLDMQPLRERLKPRLELAA